MWTASLTNQRDGWPNLGIWNCWTLRSHCTFPSPRTHPQWQRTCWRNMQRSWPGSILIVISFIVCNDQQIVHHLQTALTNTSLMYFGTKMNVERNFFKSFISLFYQHTCKFYKPYCYSSKIFFNHTFDGFLGRAWLFPEWTWKRR